MGYGPNACATLLVVEVCCYVDEQLYNLHGVSILIH